MLLRLAIALVMIALAVPTAAERKITLVNSDCWMLPLSVTDFNADGVHLEYTQVCNVVRSTERDRVNSIKATLLQLNDHEGWGRRLYGHKFRILAELTVEDLELVTQAGQATLIQGRHGMQSIVVLIGVRADGDYTAVALHNPARGVIAVGINTVHNVGEPEARKHFTNIIETARFSAQISKPTVFVSDPPDRKRRMLPGPKIDEGYSDDVDWSEPLLFDTDEVTHVAAR